MKIWPNKDPDEALKYGFNWVPRDLKNDPIVSTTAVVVEGDVVVDAHYKADAFGGTITKLSGGVDGTTCLILLTIITQSEDKFQETMKIKIKSR